MVKVGSWFIGEFGEYLLDQPVKLTGQTEDEEQLPSNYKVTEDDIIELFRKILRSPTTTNGTKNFVLNAIAKLTIRFKSQKHIEELNNILIMFSDHINVELQQRSVEYSNILNNNLQHQLLSEKIPPFESKSLNSTQIDSPKQTLSPPKTQNTLDDLLDLNITSSTTSTQTVPLKQNEDLLSSLFGNVSSQPMSTMNVADILLPSTLQPLSQTPQNNNVDLLGGSLSQQNIQESKFEPITAFENEDISILFDFIKPQPHNLQNTIIDITFTNINPNSFEVTNLDMKVSLPKYIKFQLSPASSNLLSKESKVTQQLKLANSLHGSKPVAIRLRIVYTINGQPKTFEVFVENLPKGL